MKDSFDLPGITFSFRKNLHAKCYLNEKQALLTSMNLHKYSQEHNDEMGILVSKKDDPELYDAIYQEAGRLRNAGSESSTVSTNKPILKKAETRAQTTRTAEKRPRDGFCIRCRTSLPTKRRVKPYCADCYETWNEYSNYEYEDDYCHTCGQDWAATMRKPLCASCYTMYKGFFDFIDA